MAIITLHNVPESLLAELRERAARHGKSVEDEVLAYLGTRVNEQRNADRVLTDLRQFRASLGDLYVTEAELQQAKREGRP